MRWPRLSRADLAVLGVLLLCLMAWGLQTLVWRMHGSRVVVIVAVLALGYMTVRGLLWSRENLLWSLRNRLVVAYVFIAVVPALLLLSMAGLTAYLLYWQLGSYVLNRDLYERLERVSAVADTMATSYAIEEASGYDVAAVALPEGTTTYLQAALTELPGLHIETSTGGKLPAENGLPRPERFSGLVFRDGILALNAVASRPVPSGMLEVTARVAVTPELLETLAPELGPVLIEVYRTSTNNSDQNVPAIVVGDLPAPLQRIATRDRRVPRAANLLDKLISGIVDLEVADQDPHPSGTSDVRVLASFRTRPSLLNRNLFSPFAQLGSIAVTALLITGGVFLVIEVGSLITGIVLTRTITTAVGGLYQATQHVQSGDLSFRVPVERRDQLGVLGESFNSMTHSVSLLIEEQRSRQRLENELAIAYQVQTQLFPRTLPQLSGIEVAAICRPARMVSGDYYDFIPIDGNRVGIALADISGKGISAALLMASLQAALRSNLLRRRDASGDSRTQIRPSDIVSDLNAHVFQSSSDEHYATCFFAVYDATARELTYTNAGHLPPLYLCGDRVEALETGGTVVGAFSESAFEQSMLQVGGDGVLVIYSDGVTEPTDAKGEEFGAHRVRDVVRGNREASARAIAEAIMRAAQQWSSSPDQVDDMTVVVAKFPAHDAPPPSELKSDDADQSRRVRG